MERTEFLSKTLKFRRPPNILDVGANPLDKPLYTELVESKLCNLFGFEPQKDAFDALMASKADNETYFNVAVGQQKTQTLHICKHSGFTSLYKPDLEAAKILHPVVDRMTFARALAKRMVGRTGVLGQNKTELRALSSSELDQLADYARDELRNHLRAFEG